MKVLAILLAIVAVAVNAYPGGYGRPSGGYGPPSGGYGAPGGGYQNQGGFDGGAQFGDQ
ncbi:Protein CBG06608 [Caenorhabditis briggsae]|nr:Protein CBG06608 [Caenorhabditis briggsae]CAP26890.2 Protein CBG06608 [Caenorhabditis briggsae]